MIGEKFKELVINAIAGMLEKHLSSIKEAYLKTDGITVSMPIKIQPNAKKAGFIDVEVGIRFVNSKTKDSCLLVISEIQESLFKDVKKMDEDLKKKGMTMKFTSGEKAATLGVKR